MSIRPLRSAARHAGLTAAAVATAVLAAGCAGAIPDTHGTPTVQLVHGRDGRFLADGAGHTLYLFAQDEHGESYCHGACARVWPPYLIEGSPTAGGGLARSRPGTIERADGGRQVTYAGQPLYYYAGDASEPRSVEGEGLEQFGSEWYLVSAEGAILEREESEGGEGS